MTIILPQLVAERYREAGANPDIFIKRLRRMAEELK